MKRFFRVLFTATGICTFYALPAIADIKVMFDEGAPKDYFSFQNTSGCTLEDVSLMLDLSTSKSGLIFDVTGAGAGVEVFQPLEIVSGSSALSKVPKVKDGDNQINFDIREFKAGQVIKFSIDVDDTMGGREITVSDSEVSGAKVVLKKANNVATGIFGSNSDTKIVFKDCSVAS